MFKNMFSSAATGEAAKESDFARDLRYKFSKETAKAVIEILEKLQVPVPETRAQYMSGTDGLLFFSTPHGVMLRIEKQDGKGYNDGKRANDSAWMLQPLGSVAAGTAVIEIMPGVPQETRDVESRKLFWKFWSDGYQYWDERIDNAGRLPLRSPEFPEGVTVSIDRLAASKLSNATAPIHRALEIMKGEENRLTFRSPISDPKPQAADLRAEFAQMIEEMLKPHPENFRTEYEKEGYETFLQRHADLWPGDKEAPETATVEELRIPLQRALDALTQERIDHPVGSRAALGAADPQEILYGPLRKAFASAWPAGAEVPEAAGMADFWRLAREFRGDGKLIADWEAAPETRKDVHKYSTAHKAAAAYTPLAERIGVPDPPAEPLIPPVVRSPWPVPPDMVGL